MEKKYKKFSNEWYQKFEPELLGKEKLKVYAYKFEFNRIKTQSGIERMYNNHLKEDYEMLVGRMEEQLRKMTNNKFDSDTSNQVDNLVENASDSLMKQILKDYLNDL